MPGPTKASAHDIDQMARVGYGEARGEVAVGLLGLVAVCWVIRNRAVAAAAYKAAHGKPHPLFGDGSIASVCLAHAKNAAGVEVYQFTSENPADPNEAKLGAVTLDDPDFQRCMLAALQAVHAFVPDPTQGAVNYYADTLAVVPSWAAGQPFVSLGHHRFLTGSA